jgi:hypothetical protein
MNYLLNNQQNINTKKSPDKETHQAAQLLYIKLNQFKKNKNRMLNLENLGRIC